MTYSDFQETPEVAALRPQLEAAGLDYSACVEQAVNAAYSRQYAVPSSAKSEIITYVVNFLTKLVDEKMATPAKTKGGKIARFFWGIFRIFGGKERVIKEVNKL